MADADSFSALAEGLTRGSDGAAAEVLRRFTAALVSLARRQLDSCLSRKLDAEDVVQSAYRSFFVRCRDGRFELHDWADVWHLLTLITLRKCANIRAHFRQGRRDVGREADPADGDAARHLLGREPTPEDAALLAETVLALLRLFDEPERDILVLSLQGHTVAEIGEQLGRAERSVRRVRERARALLEWMRAERLT